jgi:hypothetical protein
MSRLGSHCVLQWCDNCARASWAVRSCASQLKSLSDLAEEERVAKQKVIDDEVAALAAMASTSIQVCSISLVKPQHLLERYVDVVRMVFRSMSLADVCLMHGCALILCWLRLDQDCKCAWHTGALNDRFCYTCQVYCCKDCVAGPTRPHGDPDKHQILSPLDSLHPVLPRAHSLARSVELHADLLMRVKSEVDRVRLCRHVFVCVCICVHVFMYVCLCMYVCMCVYVYVCVCVFMCMCTCACECV